MVEIEDEELKKLGIYMIECEGKPEGWYNVKMKISLKLWLKMMYHRYIRFYIKPNFTL